MNGAVNRLALLLKDEKIFFEELSEQLLEKNWAIEEKVHDGINGTLYVDYGFKTSESCLTQSDQSLKCQEKR